MPTTTRAPNRVLDLDELETPEYRRVLDELDTLVERDDVSYLHLGKRWEYPWALGRARLQPGARVLDAGCGDSIFPVYLAKKGYDVTALDLEFTADLGKLHGVDIEYLHGDLNRLPQEDETFDAVFCISVIEHLPREQVPGAMQEMRRVLKPGGTLLLSTDYYEDAEAEMWYEGPDRRFRVDWGVFDEERFRRYILEAPGFEVEGEVDLEVDWEETRRRMRDFHGYPYTSVAAMLRRV